MSISCTDFLCIRCVPQQTFASFFLYNRSLLMVSIKRTAWVLRIGLGNAFFVACPTVGYTLFWNHLLSLSSPHLRVSLSFHESPYLFCLSSCCPSELHMSPPQHGWCPCEVNIPSHHLFSVKFGDANYVLGCMPKYYFLRGCDRPLAFFHRQDFLLLYQILSML